jgi:DNA adenine methylase
VIFIIFEPAVKWSGSKRSQSSAIIEYFPKNIDTYYEPFVGGGSIMFELIHSDIKFKNIICSDINKDLIDLWNEIKFNFEKLVESYEEMWLELNKDDNGIRRKEYYNYIRERFNKNRSPVDFLFVNRTTTNGLIRYNKKGDFNNSFHFSRKGIQPDNLLKILNYWSSSLIEKNVLFIHQDYKSIVTKSNDFMYLDPPYFNTKGMYFGTINYSDLWSFLEEQPCNYLLSFDGKQGDLDKTASVPSHLYKQHIYIESGVSSFKRLTSREVQMVQESLYIK